MPPHALSAGAMISRRSRLHEEDEGHHYGHHDHPGEPEVAVELSELADHDGSIRERAGIAKVRIALSR